MLRAEQLYSALRDPDKIHAIQRIMDRLMQNFTRPVRIMEVCGGHTHTIVKYGLDQLLPEKVGFIHGPGCPVCVLPKHRIDAALQLAARTDTILVTLGDMLRVPGSQGSLQQARATGCDIRVVYSPLDALSIAQENPDQSVVYFAIGFETTAPMTALLIEQARNRQLANLFFHINHVLIPPAMELILAKPGCRVDAFIAPGHVSVITGSDIFKPIAYRFKKPLVISGFEPVDIMASVERILRQLHQCEAKVENTYSRSVNSEGNPKAQTLMERYFEPRATFLWRGIGAIPNSALQLRPEYAALDAEVRFADDCPAPATESDHGCICGAILTGEAQPRECPLFSHQCTPTNPQGSCMVSNEGACAAYYKYRRDQ
ncbi:MAG: hydrogenase formation protein HypD [Desulfuromonadaceae bacterium]